MSFTSLLVVGVTGRNAIEKSLQGIIKDKMIDFTIVNGENSADDGRGITKSIADNFFSCGVDVITSGNHIWDKKEIVDYINVERRLLRPSNLADGSPGKGVGVYLTKDKKFKIGVINLMGNVFYEKNKQCF